MSSEKARSFAKIYSERHARRSNSGIFGDHLYANFGYWPREGMGIAEACDALTDEVALAAGMRSGDRVLEVGCGYGAGTVYYTTRYHPSEVVGIDIAEVRIENGRKRVAELGLSEVIDLRLGDATELEFAAGSFDRVVGVECALFFDTRADFLREAARVLVPGGGLGLADVIIRKGADRSTFVERVHYPIGSDGSLDVPENIYDLEVYEGILRESGFESVRVVPITEQTLPHFIVHVEQVARRTTDERAAVWLKGAEIFREYLELGQEYVLVSARKPKQA